MDLHTSTELKERLAWSCKEPGRPVVFLVGSPLTAPLRPGEPGVPGVAEMIRRVQASLQRPDIPSPGSPNPYQEAFRTLQALRGPEKVNEIVRKAVLEVCTSSDQELFDRAGRGDEEACQRLEDDSNAWSLSPGVASLARLLAAYPQQFGRLVLTSNFDPLLQIAIARAGGRSWRTALHGDGDLHQTQAEGCHVVQVHGHWYGTDTLHTPYQLDSQRPRLRASLGRFFKKCTVVVVACGGWNDIFTRTLADLASEDGEFPDIIWTFRDARPEETILARLVERFRTGLARGRVTFYGGVDCHSFFADLLDLLVAQEAYPEAAKVDVSLEPTRGRSPFSPGPPIWEDSRLFGRKEQKNRLAEAIRRGYSVQIVGERRMGKTSLLDWVRRHAPHWQGRPVVAIDAQGPAGHSPGNLARKIALQLGRSVNEPIQGSWAAVQVLEELLPLVLLVDEAAALARADRCFDQDFLDALRSFGQAGRLVWVSASHSDLKTLFFSVGLTSSFLNDAPLIRVGRLEEKAARDLLDQALEARWLEAALNEAGDLPYALQAMGDELWRAKDGFQSACDRVAEELDSTFIGWWQRRIAAEKGLLRDCLAGVEVTELAGSARRRARALVDLGLLTEREGWFKVSGELWRRFLRDVK